MSKSKIQKWGQGISIQSYYKPLKGGQSIMGEGGLGDGHFFGLGPDVGDNR